MFSSSLAYSLPEKPGVYIFKNQKNKIIYIGKALNLKKRITSYTKIKDLGEKTKQLLQELEGFDSIIVESEIEALLLEANLIKKYQPKYNISLKDGKSYPLIQLTISEKFPRVSTARKIENKKNLYFGPYPDTKTLYYLLSLIRKLFPYRSCRKIPKKRPCLYYYLNLCPAFCLNQSSVIQKDYQRTIRKIILFLNGKSNQVLQLLNQEMTNLANNKKFEEADNINKTINKLKALIKPYKLPFDYLKNPNLVSDIRIQETNELIKILKDNYPFLTTSVNKNSQFRIEAYDISNLYGQEATGSLIVFINNEPEKSQYRRFKIKFIKKPNDILMIKQVLQRRLNHQEWPLPDLMMIDGGINQIKAVERVLQKQKLSIPIIGLAKRLEIIYLTNGQTIKLPNNSLALQLLQRLRDEAHRFALFYHRKLRQKMLL